jgi:hypothetical protein
MIEKVNKDMLCKDCSHSFIPWYDYPSRWLSSGPFWYKCKRSGKKIEVDFNPVTGGKTLPADYKSCHSERGYSGECGPSAKYWSPKHKHDLFKLITR